MGYWQFGLTELTAVIRLNDCQNTAFQMVQLPNTSKATLSIQVLNGSFWGVLSLL